ncbi:SusC/RagA family TonB-linked outer membrane protein [Membranihabitans maritimus]|uniref:SusC/RagA family TonB-linked outer membrane protein n=1 Tax=Membranihabitans maritimus TaxID=2904244 RepID=UPI001F1623B2|nr:TonB-dependent receptor [Membranihabitans maritimus]
MNYWQISKCLLGYYLRNMGFKLFLIPLCCAITWTLSAQTINIKGEVVDSRGEILIGVNVLNESSGKGTTTDFDGTFIIEASIGDWLVFSYVGYAVQRLKIENDNRLSITLRESADVLDEVVVVGYGTLRSSRISSSVSKLSSEDLNNSTFARVDQAMAGKIAGIQLQESNGGAPGSSLSIKVRGVNSISRSNSPLIVVDGFPISGDIGFINPKDIESIEVLKDAASAAIYGSRGSNGVILITTKKGREKTPTFSFSSTFGLQGQLGEVGVLNRDEYLEFAIEERTNSAIYQGIDPATLTSRPPDTRYSIDPQWISNPESFPDNNWQDLINRVAPINNNQLSLSGSLGSLKYYSSVNYLDQKGIILGSDFQRTSFRSNLEGSPLDFLTLGINFSISYSTGNDPRSNWNQGPVSRSILVAPIVELGQQTFRGGYYPYHLDAYLNPVSLVNEMKNLITIQRTIANPFIQFEPVKNLFIRNMTGFDVSNKSNEYFLPNNINRGRGAVGNATNDAGKGFLSETTVSYLLERDKLGVNLLAGYSFQSQMDYNSFLEKSGFPDDEIQTLNAGTVVNSATDSRTEWDLISYFGRLNMEYEGKYLLTTSLRRDGSSRFHKSSRWGLFPSLSIGWNVDRENFMVNNKFLSSLKLRASYGTTGNNNVGNYAYSSLLNQNNYVGPNEEVIVGYSQNGFSNTDLTWETTEILDFGFDIGILKDRINLTIDYYISDTKGLLLNVPIPGITGFNSALQNIGEVQNKGVELEFMTNNLNGKVNWNTFFNISFNKNIVKKLGPTGSPIISSIREASTITEIGRSIGEYYMFETSGIFMDQSDLDKYPTYKRQEPGDLIYVDQNGDGQITIADRTHVGSNLPKFIFGLTNKFDLGNLSFSFFIDGQYGNKLLNIAKAQHGQSRGNVYDYWLNRWRSPENPGDGKTPRAVVTDNLTTPSDFWLHDASFIRIRNVSLGYILSDKILSKLSGLNVLKLSLTIDNLLMFDEYYHNVQTGTWSNSALVPGVEFDSTYPLARTFNFGIDVTF